MGKTRRRTRNHFSKKKTSDHFARKKWASHNNGQRLRTLAVDLAEFEQVREVDLAEFEQVRETENSVSVTTEVTSRPAVEPLTVELEYELIKQQIPAMEKEYMEAKIAKDASCAEKKEKLFTTRERLRELKCLAAGAAFIPFMLGYCDNLTVEEAALRNQKAHSEMKMYQKAYLVSKVSGSASQKRTSNYAHKVSCARYNGTKKSLETAYKNFPEELEVEQEVVNEFAARQVLFLDIQISKVLTTNKSLVVKLLKLRKHWKTGRSVNSVLRVISK